MYQQDWDSYITPITYAHNFRVHLSTKLTPLSPAESLLPPDLASPTKTMMPPKVSDIDSPLEMRIRLINRAAVLRQLADRNLKVEQKRYITAHNEKVRLKLIYAPGDYVLVDRSPVTTSTSDCLTNRGYRKLTPKGLVHTVCRASHRSNSRYLKKVSKTLSAIPILLTKRMEKKTRIRNYQELSNL